MATLAINTDQPYLETTDARRGGDVCLVGRELSGRKRV